MTAALLLLAALTMGPPPATGSLWWQQAPAAPVSPLREAAPRPLPPSFEPARRLP
ncbi:MAG: hypothetical protein RMM29_07040 [Planctomycetota bacterium]|nr:hypothetical protein [Planctomycetota bacterium]MCX8039679.1 hypothetical protein [Planctomycetota bacterium]MDW8373385.1 hypothetical protein [Planctomycetota bacterium]